MAYFKFKGIKISGIASAVPTMIVKSMDFADEFGAEMVEKFIDMTGVKEHRKTSEHQTASDLGFVAAKHLLDAKQIDPSTIGALLFGTHSLDYRRPATACVLHKRLGLAKECVAYDISLGCSAFVYAATTICSLMANSDIERALVIVGETMTKMANPNDRSSVMLFGDAGSAILFEKAAEESEITSLLRSDGNGYRAIIVPAGGFRNLDAPKVDVKWPDGNIRNLYNAVMEGTEVFKFTISDVPRAIKNLIANNGRDITHYDCYAMHQANRYIHQQLAKKCKMNIDKMPVSLDIYGNTSAPAIPLTLSETYGNCDDNRDINVLMCGFGVGLSWGAMDATINISDIYPVIETDEYFEEGIINSPEDMEK